MSVANPTCHFAAPRESACASAEHRLVDPAVLAAVTVVLGHSRGLEDVQRCVLCGDVGDRCVRACAGACGRVCGRGLTLRAGNCSTQIFFGIQM